MSPRPRRFGVILGAVLAAAGTSQPFAAPPAQQQQQPRPQAPVFRSSIDVVPITVTVTDRQGMPVTDLRQEDFRILENGVRREIVGFYPQTLQPGEPLPALPQVGRPRETTLELSNRRMFLIVLGSGRIQEPTKALDGAIAFVRNRLLPQDAVALLAFHRVTQFTTDHDVIVEVLGRYKKEHERLWADVRQHFFMSRSPYRVRTPAPIETDLNLSTVGGPELPDAIKADIDTSLFDGVRPPLTLRYASELLLGMDLADPKGDRSYKRQYVFAELLEAIQGSGNVLSDAVLQSSPLKLFAGIEHLRFMDGEKHLIYLGGLPPIVRNADLANLFAARANDARVIVNHIWTSGTGMRGASGCLPCRDLVERTGGFYTSLDPMEAALEKVDRRSRSSYLIGYVPVSKTTDGQYRHVRVEVARPDVTVSHRYGYFANDEPPPAELKAFVAATRTKTLVAFDENVRDIALKIDARFEPAVDGAIGPRVRVDITVDVLPLALSAAEGVHIGQLQVHVYGENDRKQQVGESKVAWELRADDATYAAWLKDGLTRTLSLPVTGKPNFVKVVVYDPASDQFGSMATAVR